ncbi:MAG TPA: amino acid adenylation domain-containing protein [Thermoanaerobaculia bacterium]|jgi:amino acid adenylation domain-containing protein|nr:amino acid adenylation domain-containing protein [Thermoanaerobaculia bacterium]
MKSTSLDATDEARDLLPLEAYRAFAERGSPAADGATLVELFQAQVARTPAAEALVHRRERLAYGELNGQANRLAHLLRARGVGPERRVAVLLERSPRLVATLLAILKAGGAYVPLDPAWPRERTAFALKDSGAALLVTAGLLAQELADTTLQVLDLDCETALAAQPETDPPGTSDPQTLAYLLYTSGSTGRPKAVGVEHRSAANLVRWAASYFAPEERAGMLAATSVCFDVSVFELFVPLCLGGKVILADNVLELPLLPAAGEITFVSTVPSLQAELTRRGPLPPAVRTVGLAGEALRRELCDRLYAQPSVTAVFNLYGPTEATTYATAARIARDDAGPPPIGRALDGLRMHVLDAELRPLAVGEPGELFIAGEGVARGYLGRPHHTAAAFLPEPGDGIPGSRMYRTGDLVCWRLDGQLEYLGRIDGQVKLHGLRIEPGEIESLLDRHPAVRHSAVIAREDRPGDKRLVAYVVPAPGAPPNAQDLLRHLAGSLPSYMVPADCVFLDALPLTPSGKLDRRALPAPAPSPEPPPHTRVAPRDPIEAAVAAVCADVLGVAEIGATDDFFALGGNSLHSAMVLSRVGHLFGVVLPAQTLLAERTVAGLAQVVSARQGEAEPIGAAALARVARNRPLPLTFGQERLWFLHRLEPGSPAYNLPVAFDVAGPLDAGALAGAVAGIAARHEVLRTTYDEAGGEAVQIIHPPPPPGLPLVDLSGLAPARRAGERDLVTAAEARRPFDLVRGPVWRPLLLRLARDEHRLLLTAHHIAADAWSLGVLAAELREGYSVGGRMETRAEPGVQVADFAAWQRASLQGDVLEELLCRWTAHLAGAPTALDLPADRSRPPVRSDHGGLRRARVSAELAGALRELGRREGATPYMVLLAALAALIARWTGRRDFLVGTPFAGRTRAELEGLIGFFVNTLVLRCDLGGGPLSFRELLARVREECLAAHGAQDLPFERLVERLQPQRDPSRNPLFQVLFVLQNAPEPIGAAGPEALPLERVDVETGTAKFDLTLDAAPAGEGFRLHFEYSADLFDPFTIERLAGHFERLLAGAVARPDEELASLVLLSHAERHHLLREWSDTAAGYGTPRCLHQLIEDQANRTPDAVAVIFAGQSLTYGELDRRANRLAHRLLRLGVQPDSPVGVCAERSLELEIALLAVLKAGAAYVPLDPEYPRERLAFMLADALGGLAAPVLLTQERLLPALPPTHARTILLDVPTCGEAEPSHRPEVPVHPDQVAYLLYTSGSTGRPKGVMSSHRGIANRLLWMQETYRLDGSDRVLQKTPASFDVSVWEFFWPLLTGAGLVMALPGGHKDPSYLARTIAEDGITTAHFVPSMLSLFLEAPEVESCGALRRVVCSGEALPYELQQRFQNRLACPLHNLYGPTEAAVDVTFWACRHGGPPMVPIGRPVANTRIHLLDTDLRQVPIGVPGELHIGGIQLARGYWLRPELTAERFVPDRQADEPGSRLYKTGDLARHRPDGAIEFLGRLDHQVKVRGVRVELGEIEAVLAEHPEVREAVVAARGTGEDTRLVAWVVPAADTTPDRRRLQADLKARLPEPMVPTAWVFLAAMPLTPSGKVDRRALPEPDLELRGMGAAFVAPRTPVEEVVAGIWSEVLGVEPVGAEDHFFALGGHSLLAAKVASRLRTVFGVEMPLRRLFEATTVAALAAAVETLRRAGSAAATPPLASVPRTGPLLLSSGQRRLWFLDQLTPGLPMYNIPLPLRLTGALDPGTLALALSEVVRRHEPLRTTFAAVEGEPLQVVARARPMPLPVIDLGALTEESRCGEARRLLDAESRRPFDLAAGPVLHAALLRLATGGTPEHWLLLTLHHIAADGWTLDIVTRELLEIYEAFSAGRPSPLPEPSVQYADFAAWQRSWLAGETLAGQLDYWRRQLAGVPASLELPTDRSRPALRSHRGALAFADLPPGFAAALRAFCRREGATVFMAAMAALDALLHRYTRQADLTVGYVVANRNHAETESMVGFFANTLVLRANLAGQPPFRALLGQVRETALGAYDHQDLPFDVLVEELQPERDLSRTPLFQVMLNVHGVTGCRELGSGLRAEPLAVNTSTAKFDLTVTVIDAEPLFSVELEYATDLFDPPTAVRLLAHLTRLIAGAVAMPASPIAELPILSAAERAQVLAEWTDTAPPREAEVCLHQLFEAQAARTPDAVALVSPDGGQRLSYRELDRRAEDLAGRLRALGVGPEALAGVLMDRTVELIVSLLAVLKAGGAYVPIDPAYPRHRVAVLLENSRAAVLLTRRSLLAEHEGRLPSAAVPVFLDSGAQETEGVAARSAVQPLPTNLAYIIYTSGSTGEPKGVAIEHRSAVAFARWAREVFPPEERACVLGSTSICFDISIMEIFVTLAWGGRILLAENALALPTLPARHELTMINAVPSAMAELVRSGRLPDSVRTVNVGGEAVKGLLARRIYEQSRAGRVVNVYGPSEDTTYSTTSEIPRDVENPAVGRPVLGSRIYVLDAALRPVPIGVPGAVYLAGEGLARGYLRRPDLTAERFIPDPHGAPGARLYRVGDLARWRPDGEVDYLGRIDHQVKVRGFRIELGEVEAALARHPGVREGAVLALPEPGGTGNRLAAFVVPAGGHPPLAADLRAALQEVLPEYMVPTSYSFLPDLPLTPNGKLDRLTLERLASEADLAVNAGGSSGAVAAPRTPVEEVLAGIWADVFERPVGIHDDFFDLGGHSLLAVRVAARVRASLGSDVPLHRLFESPTVATLAAALEKELRSDAPISPSIRPAPRSEPLTLSFGQQRLWFLDQLTPGNPTFNIPLAARLSGPLDATALASSLAAVLRRHESLRTTFTRASGKVLQVVAPPSPEAAPLPLVDLRVLPEAAREDEAHRLAAADGRRPFDLARGPLLRVTLVRLAPEESWLLLCLHHIAADGWSVEILLDELAEGYEARLAGRLPGRPPLLIQYADFAAWQRGWLQGDAPGHRLDYWRARLGGTLPVLDLAPGRPAPAGMVRRGDLLTARLPSSLGESLRRLARQEGSTLYMVLLAAFGELLRRWAGTADLLIGTPIARRELPELEPLIGFFVDTLVLRLDAAGDPSFQSLVGRVREVALGGYAHADLPFDKLVEELQPQRAAGTSPLFQVMFALHSPRREAWKLGEARLTPVEIHNGTSQFDWTLYVVDADGELTVQLEYDRDRFDAATARLALAHYSELLEAAAANPERPASALAPGAVPARPQALPEPPPASAPRPERGARRSRIAEMREGLTPEQRALVESRLRGRRAPGAASRLSLVPLEPTGERPPLFCVHPAGGDVLCFRGLSRYLGPGQPVYGLQSRGLVDGQEPHESLAEMAASYLGELLQVRSDGPYLLCGWSLGGLVAYEMARQLQARGGAVALLAVVDTVPRLPQPGEREAEEEQDDTRWLMDIADYIEALADKRLGLSYGELRTLDPEERLRRFTERLAAAELLPPGGTVEHLRRLLRVFRANVRAARSYDPAPYPGRITLLRASDQAVNGDPTLGWSALSGESVKVHSMAGTHLTLLAEPHVQELAARLRADIDVALEGSAQ